MAVACVPPAGGAESLTIGGALNPDPPVAMLMAFTPFPTGASNGWAMVKPAVVVSMIAPPAKMFAVPTPVNVVAAAVGFNVPPVKLKVLPSVFTPACSISAVVRVPPVPRLNTPPAVAPPLPILNPPVRVITPVPRTLMWPKPFSPANKRTPAPV